MMSEAARRFAALPTAGKLLLVLTAALLPIGLGLVLITYQGIRDANVVLQERAEEQSQLAARAIESLIARNALALRIAANNRVSTGPSDLCLRVQRSLTIAPAVAQRFELESADGQPLCEVGTVPDTGSLPVVAPGDIALQVAPDEDELIFRVGVIGGMATGSLPIRELRDSALTAAPDVTGIIIRDDSRQLEIISSERLPRDGQEIAQSTWPIGSGRLSVQVGARVPMITRAEQLLLLLPLVMWIVAAMIGWTVVTRFLIRPLRRLQRAVIRFEPGDSAAVLPTKLGPATEIQELRDSFARAVSRVEESERDMGAALEGQRRLVREVHHRVKNNLQVVASLLNIHGRTAGSADARAAYGAIGRRVGALAIVHRSHFAELEEQRGISLRPLISEIAAELRAGAPESARSLRIDLELEGANTTQDVAVSVAFLITEIVEFAMLRRPQDPIEISLRRTSDLTARLTLTSPVLNPEESGDAEKVQFERIISGLAKQLRSELDRKLGRYSVELPVFPPL